MSERGKVRFGNTEIEYTVARSKRRKTTIAIQLNHGQGVLVTAPVKTSAQQIRQVVEQRAEWIIRKAAEVAQPARRRFVTGESLPYLGGEIRLFVEQSAKRRPTVTLEKGNLYLTLPTGLDDEQRLVVAENALLKWYKTQALEKLTDRSDYWARVAGYAPNQVLVRDQRRRWGSCAPDGTLRFNWRIIMTHPSLIDYLVVHELAHIRVRNHSRDFWDEVCRMLPDYRSRRAALKKVEPRLAF